VLQWSARVSTSRLEIDLAALDKNIATVRAVTGQTGVQLCAVIKQDAYGMGAARIAKRLASIGVDLLAVYCVAEARKLAESHVALPVLCLMPVSSFERNDVLYRLAVNARLHLTLHSLAQTHEVIALAGRLGVDFPVHVQVDTGLSRGGCLPDEAEKIVEAVVGAQRLRLAGVMTHFSSPSHDDAFTSEQAKLFRSWIDRIKPLLQKSIARGHAPCVVHAANTAATFRSSKLHATMVRVGQAMFGYGGETLEDTANIQFMDKAKQLVPAVRWLSRIVHTHEIPAGWPVGYNRTFVADRPSKIAVVPVGYADGYPTSLSNIGQVRLTGLASDRPLTVGPTESINAAKPKGVFCPVVGRVSMDQITIDVTDAPADLCKVGMEVEIVGNDVTAPNHLPTIAHDAGSITHELLCRISPMLDRVYLFSGGEESVGQDESRGTTGVIRTQAAGPSPRKPVAVS
jgi:alanine racemase